MKLYESAATPSCRRVSIFLKLINTDVERISVDLKGGENITPEFQAKSASGTVPLLELDDGNYISESTAICRYFEHIVPNNVNLFGRPGVESAQVEMWQRIVEFQGLIAGFQAFRNITGFYSDRENCVSEWGEESKSRAIAFLDKLDARLSHSSFIATDHLSVADITGFLFVNLMKGAFKVEIDEQYSHIQVWHTKLAAMPEFQ
ncbi:glutathione S-transferase [Vibrio sp. UCD-FRSSP16_10]|uniref:glutathione S-transferase n=1 Tax=unclassified Vibrio TaxID=2614977 RepID=UPI0007FDC1AC|nr:MULTISPECIES: glutathione S-transferase [unclassified Vibrio]OBT09420.1 glutathione S-transferase [Vibrio sp. UCD-FRSSP16_30]OBT22099.1 glutathione S-transferase [Vibrio sp. UCD-FRSSP16_10]